MPRPFPSLPSLPCLLLGLSLVSLTVSCSTTPSAIKPSVTSTATVQAASPSPSADSPASLLIGDWEMEMEELMDVSELSAQEQAHLSGMMSEMMVVLTFTDEGTILSSMDDSVVQYEVVGDRLLLDGSPADFTVSPTQLTLEGNGEVLTFVRSSGATSDVAEP